MSTPYIAGDTKRRLVTLISVACFFTKYRVQRFIVFIYQTSVPAATIDEVAAIDQPVVFNFCLG